MDRTQLLDVIATNDKAAVSALIALYHRQTADEQQTNCTREDNNRGFNGLDAGILSSIAQQAINNRASKRYPTDLSPKQLALVRKKLPKYGRQLEEIAAEKAADKAARAPHARAPAPPVQPEPQPRRLKIEELEHRVTVIPIDPALPGYVMADGTRITDQFVYGSDGVIWPRNTTKMISKAVDAKWGHIRREEPAMGADPMDAYFAV